MEGNYNWRQGNNFSYTSSWYMTLDPEQEIFNLSAIEATYSYIAEYAEVTYTIVYHGNGETSGSMSPQNATLSVTTHVKPNSFEKMECHSKDGRLLLTLRYG